MQCGLGAFSAAALHIVAHGLYKAHAFLSSGGSATRPARRPGPPPGRALLVGCAALAAAAGVVALGQSLTGVAVLHKPGGVVIGSFLTAGVAVLLFWALTADGLGVVQRVAVAGLGLPLVLVYLGSWKLLDAALSPFLALARPLPGPSAFNAAFSLAVAGATAAALFAGWAGPALARTGAGRSLYVHALNGFYIADCLRTPFNRRRAARAPLRLRAG